MPLAQQRFCIMAQGEVYPQSAIIPFNGSWQAERCGEQHGGGKSAWTRCRKAAPCIRYVKGETTPHAAVTALLYAH